MSARHASTLQVQLACQSFALVRAFAHVIENDNDACDTRKVKAPMTCVAHLLTFCFHYDIELVISKGTTDMCAVPSC